MKPLKTFTKFSVILVGDADFRFLKGRCHTCFNLGLDKVETGYKLLLE